MNLEVLSSVFWSYPQSLRFSFLKIFKSFNTFTLKFINEFNALADFTWDKPKDMWDKSREVWDQLWELWDKPRNSKDNYTQPKYLVFQTLKWAKSETMSHLRQKKWAAYYPSVRQITRVNRRKMLKCEKNYGANRHLSSVKQFNWILACVSLPISQIILSYEQHGNPRAGQNWQTSVDVGNGSKDRSDHQGWSPSLYLNDVCRAWARCWGREYWNVRCSIERCHPRIRRFSGISQRAEKALALHGDACGWVAITVTRRNRRVGRLWPAVASQPKKEKWGKLDLLGLPTSASPGNALSPEVRTDPAINHRPVSFSRRPGSLWNLCALQGQPIALNQQTALEVVAPGVDG